MSLAERREAAVEPVTVPAFPGAREPDRAHTVPSLGISIRVYEWGDPQGDPMLFCHGFWDHARSFAVLGPLLARRYRVLAMDARGHGDSSWSSAYSWVSWVTDIVNVLRWIGRPTYVVGHSMGGGQTSDAARTIPELVKKLVNIDGFGPPPLDENSPKQPQMFRQYLDYRRKISQRPGWRPYPSLENLIVRRKEQNPRLQRPWLDYFTYWAARQTEEGWTWKADPQMAVGMGPWKPEWIAPSYAYLEMPMLAIIGSEADTWGPLPEEVLAPRLAYVRRLTRATIQGAGHFVHMEQPEATAAAISDFLAS